MASHAIILDGFLGRPRRWERLRRGLETPDHPAEIFRYDATGRSAMDAVAAGLVRRVRAISTPVNLIGYSMGGLVVRTARLLDPTLPVDHAVFLNTPHGGSSWARLLDWPGLRQLVPGSDLLRRLARQPWTIPTLNIYNPLDTAVVPPRHTRWDLPGITEDRCRIPVHIWPVVSRRLHQRVVDFIRT